jgi:NAD-dependent dihydropyrimidine dehydrogenase PreA subunit
MKRAMITIAEAKCTGCGACIPNCPEGALQVIDGKARVISDLLCDGLGACIGHCPEGAMSVTEREAEPYDERKVIANIVTQGPNVVKAHLAHLRDHGQTTFLKQAADYLAENNIPNPMHAGHDHHGHEGCPGARMRTLKPAPAAAAGGDDAGRRPSRLAQWPVQLHLVSPNAPYFQKSDLLLAADCTAFALGDFHKDFLKGKSLTIACPKLDADKEVYVDKLAAMIDQAQINTLTVLIMEVPCCRGLLALAQQAVQHAGRTVPVKCVTVSLQGEVLEEKWV